MRNFVIFLFLCVSSDCVCGAKILAVSAWTGKSHFVYMEPLFLELAKRGHQVTVLSHFPRESKTPNYREISLVGSRPSIHNNLSFPEVSDSLTVLGILPKLVIDIIEMESVMHSEPVKQLINSTEEFDLVINDLFINDVFAAFANKFNAPLISMVSSVLLPWANYRVANPDNPAYIPNFFSPYSNNMCFKERLLNTINYILTNIASIFYLRKSDIIVKQHFGNDYPPLEDILKNTSLLMVNSFPVLTGARPTVPQVVQIGGIHLKPVKRLPQDIEKFINKSKHGVVYFSMGSMVKLSTLPEDKFLAFKTVLSHLPQRVLWKWEEDTMPDQPKNVKIAKWFPQRDILAHPNVKLFISHGGLMSTTEAVYSGVPMIGIPLFGDQPANLAAVEAKGAGIQLHFHNISLESVEYAVNTVLNDPRYAENAKRLSELYRDRPVSAMDTAVYWTEYVIRHKGTKHLQSAAMHLAWYQYLLLDVILVIGVVVLAAIVISYYTVKYSFLLITYFLNRRKKLKKA